MPLLTTLSLDPKYNRCVLKHKWSMVPTGVQWTDAGNTRHFRLDGLPERLSLPCLGQSLRGARTKFGKPDREGVNEATEGERESHPISDVPQRGGHPGQTLSLQTYQPSDLSSRPSLLTRSLSYNARKQLKANAPKSW